MDSDFVDVFRFDYGVFGQYRFAGFAEVSQLFALPLFHSAWFELDGGL